MTTPENDFDRGVVVGKLDFLIDGQKDLHDRVRRIEANQSKALGVVLAISTVVGFVSSWAASHLSFTTAWAK